MYFKRNKSQNISFLAHLNQRLRMSCCNHSPSVVHHTSVRTYARYIPRLTFVRVSVYSVIVGLKIGVVRLKINKKGCCGIKEDQRKIKGITS